MIRISARSTFAVYAWIGRSCTDVSGIFGVWGRERVYVLNDCSIFEAALSLLRVRG